MNLKEIKRGIPHIEDLGPLSLLEVYENLHNYAITEKVDGSQILIGYDKYGFYTSRETKGGSRIYHVSEYDQSKFSSSYMRSAHLLMEEIKGSLREVGFKPGIQVEAEVLYGALPNVVPYDPDVNRIIFLRCTEGSINLGSLARILSDKSISINLLKPATRDGKSIVYENVTDQWKFSSVPVLSPSRIQGDRIGSLIRNLRTFLEKQDSFINQSYRTILETPLNRIPSWKSSTVDWCILKGYLKERKEKIIEDSAYLIAEIKQSLLESYVLNTPSRFSKDKSCGWIEGVVFRNPQTGHMFKVVDKTIFGQIRESAWKVRNQLTESARSENSNLSFKSNVLVTLARALGDEKLGTRQAQRLIEDRDYISNLESYVNFHQARDFFENFIDMQRDILDEYLKRYLSEQESGILVERKIDIFVKQKTLESFADTFRFLDDIHHRSCQAKSNKDLFDIVLGRYIDQ